MGRNTQRPLLAEGTVLDGRFRIIEPLGGGGMGTVYRAVQTTIGRHVAIKVLRPDVARDPKAVKRFHREAQAVSVLAHPNIVTVHDFGQLADASLYLVLELIEGHDLSKILVETGPMRGVRVAHIAAQILDALEEAHAAGVVHRDLKPENILLTHAAGNVDFVKVVDFGLAHMAEEGTLTQTGEIFGTPVYISPEQARGLRADNRADLYALGVMLYEMLTGRPPFSAKSSMALLMQHMRNPPPSFEKAAPNLRVGKELVAVVMRALEKSPDDRFATAAAMRDALTAAVEAGDPESDLGLTQLDHMRSTAPDLGTSMAATIDPTAVESGNLSALLNESDPLAATAAPDAGYDSSQVLQAVEGSAAPAPSPPPPKEAARETHQVEEKEDESATPSLMLNATGWSNARFMWIAVAGIGGLAVLGLLAMIFSSDPEPVVPPAPPVTAPVVVAPKPKPPVKTPEPKPPPKPPEPMPPPKVVTVTMQRVDFASNPPGAAVKVGVRAPGESSAIIHRFPTTPAHLEVPSGSAIVATFTLEGREPTGIEWVAAEPRTVLAQMPKVKVAAKRPRRRPRVIEKTVAPPPPRPPPKKPKKKPKPEDDEDLDDLK